MQTLIVGAGNLGTNVAYNLLRRGDSVIVTTRNEDRGKDRKCFYYVPGIYPFHVQLQKSSQ